MLGVSRGDCVVLPNTLISQVLFTFAQGQVGTRVQQIHKVAINKNKLDNVGEEAGKARLAARLLQVCLSLSREPGRELVIAKCFLVIARQVCLLAVSVVRDGAGPEEVLVQSSVDLDARDDDVLAGVPSCASS